MNSWLVSAMGLTARIVTPFPPAVLLATEVYRLLYVDGEGVPYWIALMVAIAAIIGVELTGGLAAFQFVYYWAREEWERMWLAGVGVVGYALLVVFGIIISGKGAAIIFVVWVGMSIIAYFVYGMIVSHQARQAEQQIRKEEAVQEHDQEFADAEAEARRQLELLHQQRLLTNAQRRLAQEQGLDLSLIGHVRGEHATNEHDSGSKEALIHTYLDEFGLQRVRVIQADLELAGHGTISLSTISKHVKTWKEEHDEDTEVDGA